MKFKVIKCLSFFIILCLLINCKQGTDDSSSNNGSSNNSTISLPAPNNFKASNITYLGADLTWDKVDNAYDYYLEMGNGKFVVKDNKYTIKNTIPGQTQTITIIARTSSYKEGKKSSINVTFPNSTANTTNYPYPKNFVLKSRSGTSVTLEWSQVVLLNVLGYYVYLSTDGVKYNLASSYNGTSVTYPDLKPNTKYYFKIAAKYKDETISQYSPTIVQVTTGSNSTSGSGTGTGTGSGSGTGGGTGTGTSGGTTTTSSVVQYSGSKCYLKIRNDSRDAGHYIYKVVVQDTDNKNHTLISRDYQKIKSSKDSVINYETYDFKTNEKVAKNDIKVTVYAKGGSKGSRSGSAYISPSSKSISNITLYWSGVTLSK